jgi:hypothetical protein
VRVDYAFVAESADSQNGLFYVTRGGADIYLLPRDFPRPLRLGAISFVVRVIGDDDDIGRARPIACTVVDHEGRALEFRQQAEVRFEAHPVEPGRSSAGVMTFRLFGLPVPEFGGYRFRVASGEQELASVPFWVVPADAFPQGVPGQATESAERPGYL